MAVVLLVLVDGPFALRLPVGLVYAFVVPGFAVVGLLRLFDLTTEVVLSVVVSIALGIAVSQVAAWFDAYSVGATLGALAAITTPCLVVQLHSTGKGDTRPHLQWTRSYWT